MQMKFTTFDPAELCPVYVARAFERFMAKVYVDPVTGCWLWRGRLDPQYGVFDFLGKDLRAHRFSFFLFWRRFPDPEKELHHRCETPSCVNPFHTQEVTYDEHVALTPNSFIAAKRATTHCPRGHPLVGDNVRVRTRGNSTMRECRICRRVFKRASKKRARERMRAA